MMRPTRTSLAAVAALATAALPLAIAPAPAEAAPTAVLDLQLNEPAGASVTRDSSGAGHDGAIGSHLVMNRQSAAFDLHSPGAGVSFGAQHLILVPDARDGSLDPGAGNFTVELRFRTTERFGNVLQKGQATSVGGQVKFQIPKGKLSCMFKTPQGTATAGSGTRLLNDNAWHVVRCERTPTSVTMFVDGVRTGRKNGFTGNLDNNKPWSLGGKPDCDGVQVTCDYFHGDIDYVRLTKG
jgi:hypothetical protein